MILPAIRLGTKLLSSAFSGATAKTAAGTVGKKIVTGIGKGSKAALKKAPITTGVVADQVLGGHGAGYIGDQIKEKLGFDKITETFNKIAEKIEDVTGMDMDTLTENIGPALLTIAGGAILGGIVNGSGGAMMGTMLGIMYSGYKHFAAGTPQTAELKPATANNG